MNAIRGFSAPLNGVRPGYLAKMSNRQKQQTRKHGGCGIRMANVEKLSPKPGRPALSEAASRRHFSKERSAVPKANMAVLKRTHSTSGTLRKYSRILSSFVESAARRDRGYRPIR
jgi:hypothetical protein